MSDLLCIGRRVSWQLYGGKVGTIVRVHGTPRPETVKHLAGGAVVVGGAAHVDVVWDDGSESRGVPEGIVTGCQWDLLDRLVSRDDVLRAIGFADQVDAKRRDEAEAAKRQKAVDKEAAIAELRKEYPWAVSPTDKRSSQARAAANLRKELRKAFPGIKFRVRSSSFSGGDSIHVEWTLGPTTKEVEQLAGKYEGGSFDGMQDLYEYDHSAYGEAVDVVLGRAKYVSCTRRFGDEVRETVGRALCAAQRVEYAGPHTRHVYGPGDIQTLSDHLWRLFGETSLPAGAQITGVEHGDDGYRVTFSR